MLNCIRPVSPTARNVVIVATILVVISAVALAAIYKQPIDYKKFNWPSRKVCLGAALATSSLGLMVVAGRFYWSEDRKYLRAVPCHGQEQISLKGYECDQGQTALDAHRQFCFLNGLPVKDKDFLAAVSQDSVLNQYTNQALSASISGILDPRFQKFDDKGIMTHYVGSHLGIAVNVVIEGEQKLVELVFLGRIEKIGEEGPIPFRNLTARLLVKPGEEVAEVMWNVASYAKEKTETHEVQLLQINEEGKRVFVSQEVKSDV